MVSQGRRDFEGLPKYESGAEIGVSLSQKRDNSQRNLFQASSEEDRLQNNQTYQHDQDSFVKTNNCRNDTGDVLALRSNDGTAGIQDPDTRDDQVENSVLDRGKTTLDIDEATTNNISVNADHQQESASLCEGNPPSVERGELETIPHSTNVSQHMQTSSKAQNLSLGSEMLLSGVQTIPEQLPLILTEGDAEEHESLTIIAGTDQLQGVSTQAVLGTSSGPGTSGLVVFSSADIGPTGQIIPIGGTNLLVLHNLDGHGQVLEPSAVVVAGQTQVMQKDRGETREEKAEKKAYECPEPGCTKVTATSSKLKLHMLSHTGERPHKCPLSGCEWAFTTAYKLKRHMRGHTGEKPFICEINDCGKCFTTTYNLKTHQKAHIREQSNICSFPDCGLSFTTLHRLRVHEKKHVVTHEQHTCTVDGCSKQFKSLGYYNTHLKTHSGERPHACSYEGCSKRFTKASKLKLHVRTHTGERPFVCEEEGCSWSFTSAYKLKRHMRKHSGERPYTCQYSGCGKSFTRASHMRTHQMSHTGTKPFICNYQNCRKGFTAASTLSIHLRKHAGDKPFKCTVEGCDKAYTTGANLRLHQKRHEEKISGQDEGLEQERTSDQPTSIHYVQIGGVNSVVGSSPNSVSNTPYSVMHTFSGEDFASEDVASLTVVQFSSEETFPPQTPVSNIDSTHGICFQFSASDSYAATSHSNPSPSISNLSFTAGTPLPSPGAHYVQATIGEVDVVASGELGPSSRSRNTDQVNSEGYVIREQTSCNEEYISQEETSGTQDYVVQGQTSGDDGYVVREESSPSDGYIVREQSSQTREYIPHGHSSDRGKRSEDLTLPTMVVFTSPDVQPSARVVRPDVTQSQCNNSSENSLDALTLRQRCESTSIGQFAPPSIIFQGEDAKQPEVEPKLRSPPDIHSNIKDDLSRNTSSRMAGLAVSNLSLNLSLSDDIDKSPVSPFITDVHDHPLDHESTINLQDLR